MKSCLVHGNAGMFDFVSENDKIEIGINDGDKEVTFFVKDNGEGIQKEKQTRQ